MKKIIVVSILFFGVLFLAGCGQKEKKAQLPAPEKEEPNNSNSQSEIIYKNEEFGFQLSLPKDWEGYEVDVRKDEGNEKITYIDFSYSKGGVFSIGVSPLSDWEKFEKKCKEDPGLECNINKFISRSEKYAFALILSDRTPGDNYQIKDETLDSIRKSFKLIADSSNWKIYKNDKYGFEFKYPSYLKLERVDDTPFAIFIVILSNRKQAGNLKEGDIVLQVEIAKKAMSLDDDLKSMTDAAKDGGVRFFRYKEITVSGFPSIQQMEDVKVSDPGCYWSTYIKKGDRYDKIILMSAKCDTIIDAEADYDKILSTFKFTK